MLETLLLKPVRDVLQLLITQAIGDILWIKILSDKYRGYEIKNKSDKGGMNL
jgi:hypothetical protein